MRISSRASEGTSVRDSRYEASIASTTEIASGVNRKRAGPTSSTTGKKTMQIDSVATMAGVAIWWAPSRIARVSGLPMLRLRWMFSTSTVASSTSIPIASASPPSVMMLMLWPVSFSPTSAEKIASGIEVQTITMLRQLPRKSPTISDTSSDEMIASRTTPEIAARTNSD